VRNYLISLLASDLYQSITRFLSCVLMTSVLTYLLDLVYMQGTLLDFFGVPVKAYEMLARLEELQLLGKRIARYKDPVTQFRLMIQHKTPQWSKSCGWTSSKCCQHFSLFHSWYLIVMDRNTNYFLIFAEFPNFQNTLLSVSIVLTEYVNFECKI
jgi:hypothetical protein